MHEDMDLEQEAAAGSAELPNNVAMLGEIPESDDKSNEELAGDSAYRRPSKDY